jgi:transcriptional regulator with GAF, ATPase, and Fis domain
MPLVRTLLAINTAIIEAEGSEKVLEVIIEAAAGLFEAEVCRLALLDKENRLAFVFSSGGASNGNTVPSDAGFGGWVVQNGRPLMSNKPAADPRYSREADGGQGIEPRSIICAPVYTNGERAGVIQVVNTRKEGGFEEEDTRIFSMFAKMAGTAVKQTEYQRVIQTAGMMYRAEERRRNRLVGYSSPIMQEVISTAQKAAESNATVLLMSESGTGKELVARSIHRWSPRTDAPFIAVNCVALTPELLASELFGHEKGAFTGAAARKTGKFELAEGGTIFLDEIGELNPDLQAKLLRVLQEREFQRVGGNQNIKVDVRIIAATNRDLQKEVHEGRFREDLFYRLNVVVIKLPPLRERGEDLKELVDFFLSRYCREMNRPLLQVTPEVKRAIMGYDWPGNVRQLQNTIERAVVLTRGSAITPEVLPPELISGHLDPGTAAAADFPALSEDVPMAEAVEALQREKIRRALATTGGNKSKAAALLGLQPPNFSRLLKRLGVTDKNGAKNVRVHA